MFKNTEANLSDYEQQLLALQRLHHLHRNINKAKAKSNAFFTLFLPFVIGFGLGSIALMVGYFIFPSSSRGFNFLHFLLFVSTWIIMTLLSRRIAKRQSAILVSQAETPLHAAAEEISQRLPDWTEKMGGVATLLNARRVADALLVMRRQHPAVSPTNAFTFAGSQPAVDVLPAYPITFKYRAPASICPLTVITIGIYFLVWIYKIHTELSYRLGPQRTTSSGLALGLLFIPFFSMVWVIILLYKVATLANQMLVEQGLQPAVSTGGLLAILIILQIFSLASIYQPLLIIITVPLFWVGTSLVQSALNQAWEAQGLIAR